MPQQRNRKTQSKSRGTTNSNSSKKKKGGRGFASMDAAKQRAIASKGGQAVSRDRKHMAEIGRKGGSR